VISARPRDAAKLAQCAAVVGRVLDDVEAGDEVELRVGERQLLDDRLADVLVPARARHGDRVGARVDAARVPVVTQHLEVPPRATAGIEDAAPVVVVEEAVELCSHDPAPAAVPPVALVGGEHGLELAGDHGASLGDAVLAPAEPALTFR
jgi:hypothetical protein